MFHIKKYINNKYAKYILKLLFRFIATKRNGNQDYVAIQLGEHIIQRGLEIITALNYDLMRELTFLSLNDIPLVSSFSILFIFIWFDMRKVTNIFGKLNIANKLEEQYKLTNELVDYHLKNYSSNNNNIKNVTDILKSVLPVYPKIIFNILNTCDW